MKILTSQKEIRDFLKQEGEFGWGFNYTDYNFYITIKDVSEWKHKLFYVYHGEGVDEKDPIVNEFVKIVSESGLPSLKRIVNYCKPLPENSIHERSSYGIRVSKIEKIEPELKTDNK